MDFQLIKVGATEMTEEEIARRLASTQVFFFF